MSEDTKLILEKLEEVISSVNKLEGRMDALEGRMDSLEKRLDKVEQESCETRLQIENKIISNIQLLAESHLDLHKKVEAAMEAKTERELHLMRTAILEEDMRRVKEKVGIA